MQKILIKGHAGLTHMLSVTFCGLGLSNLLNKPNKIYHEWPGFTFNEIFEVNHLNYSTEKFTNDEELPLIIASNYCKDNHLNYIRTSQLTYKISEDFNKTSDKCVLVIDGGCQHGCPPELFFKTLKLKPPCFNIFKNLYTKLNNGKYVALNFRGGDQLKNKKINLQDFLKDAEFKIEKALKEHSEPLYLASDNQDILVKYVDEKRIFSDSIAWNLYKKHIILDPQQKLHGPYKKYTKEITDFEESFSSVLDFLLLSHSDKFYPDLKSGFGQCSYEFYQTLKKSSDLRILQ